jgi:hypothetical protein
LTLAEDPNSNFDQANTGVGDSVQEATDQDVECGPIFRHGTFDESSPLKSSGVFAD